MDFPYLEELFKININVYNMQEDAPVIKIYTSCKSHGDDTLYLNDFDGHLSYIKNFPSYAKKFKCEKMKKNVYWYKGIEKAQKIAHIDNKTLVSWRPL